MKYFIYLGVSASPPAPGSKSAAGSRVAAKLQKELPPVALLQQRPHRLPSLRAFRLSASRRSVAEFFDWFLMVFTFYEIKIEKNDVFLHPYLRA